MGDAKGGWSLLGFSHAVDGVVKAANVISNNGGSGVRIAASIISTAGNRVLSNSIYSNGALGIDLSGGTADSFGVTANDEDDPDTGSNNLQNFPNIASATRNSTNGTTTISGTLNSNVSQSYTNQFLAAPDPSGNGEGRTLLATTTTATDENGDSPTFTCTTSAAALGKMVTMTATNTGTGDTSEFSENVAVTTE